MYATHTTQNTTHNTTQARRFDPPGKAQARIRTLNDAESAVTVGHGYRRGRPGGTAETNPKLGPYKARGLYPRPGIYYEMARSNPVIASGLYKLELTISALPWRIVPPPDATADELDRTEWIRDSFRAIGGLAALVARVVGSTCQYGFYLSESVYDVDDGPGGRVQLVKASYIEPWQVSSWKLDKFGDLLGAYVQGSTGLVELDAGRMIHLARRFTGRNFEGESALRSLWYYHEAKRRCLTSEEIYLSRVGSGFPKFSLNENAGDADADAAEDIAKRFVSGPRSFFVEPEWLSLSWEHGGSVLPDYSSKLKYIDHQCRSVLSDNLAELGTSQYGARAVGAEMRVASDRAAEGLTLGLAVPFDSIITGIYERNGWDTRRQCRTIVSGFGDPSTLRLVMEGVRDGTLPLDADVQQYLKRGLGVSNA